jgi:hypothetical protein
VAGEDGDKKTKDTVVVESLEVVAETSVREGNTPARTTEMPVVALTPEGASEEKTVRYVGVVGRIPMCAGPPTQTDYLHKYAGEPSFNLLLHFVCIVLCNIRTMTQRVAVHDIWQQMMGSSLSVNARMSIFLRVRSPTFPKMNSPQVSLSHLLEGELAC